MIQKIGIEGHAKQAEEAKAAVLLCLKGDDGEKITLKQVDLADGPYLKIELEGEEKGRVAEALIKEWLIKPTRLQLEWLQKSYSDFTGP